MRAAAWNLLWALNQRTTHPELDDLYSHKETESTVDEAREEALHPLTRDEILQRCREAQDVYVISKSETIWSGRCYLQFAIPDNECDPLSVFMYPLEGEGHTPFLYTPEEFEVYDTYPSPKSLKKTKDNDIKPKEPTAIEPLSKELLLGMNGRFVYLMQAVSLGRPKEDINDNVELGWVRVKVVENDIFIVSEDDNQNVVAEVKFDPSWMRCYISNPITKKKE